MKSIEIGFEVMEREGFGNVGKRKKVLLDGAGYDCRGKTFN